jgi:hypothetical protein
VKLVIEVELDLAEEVTRKFKNVSGIDVCFELVRNALREAG